MKSILIKAGGLFSFLILVIAALVFSVRFSDGPKGPLAGGALKSGTLIPDTKVDWSSALGDIDGAEIVFHLESTQRSRTTGSIVYEDQLYVPCDLGFMWKRFSGGTKFILQTMYTLKTWHEEAMLNGDVVIRIGDSLYERSLKRVSDPRILDELRNITEQQVDGSYMGPLPEVEGDPDEIWYFLVEARS